MSGGPGDFLSRWSRRKRDTRRSDEAVQPEAEAAPAQDAPADETEPELGPEEIEALPNIEEIAPDTDITVFLRKGVPELLRKAALRRLWSVDPAIRDYVGDARDYAYDWNVPGGVPGNGPLLPTDDVGAMLNRLFGGPDPESEKPAPERAPTRTASQSGEPEYTDAVDACPEDTGPDDDAAQKSDDPRPPSEHSGIAGIAEDKGEARLDTARAEDGALPLRASTDGPQPPRRRRHGGARPV